MKLLLVQKSLMIVLMACAMVAVLFVTPSAPQAADVDQIIIIINKERKDFADEPGNNAVKRIFLKEDKKWKDGKAFYVVGQKGTDEFKIFRKQILGKTEAELATYWSDMDNKDGTKPPKAVKTSKDVFRYVSKKKDAIGYVSKSFFNNLTKEDRAKIRQIKKISK